jgi:hypothetical protein
MPVTCDSVSRDGREAAMGTDAIEETDVKEEKDETEPSERFVRRGRTVDIEFGRSPNKSRHCVLATSTGLRLLWCASQEP